MTTGSAGPGEQRVARVRYVHGEDLIEDVLARLHLTEHHEGAELVEVRRLLADDEEELRACAVRVVGARHGELARLVGVAGALVGMV